MSSGVALLRQYTSPGKVYDPHHAEKGFLRTGQWPIIPTLRLRQEACSKFMDSEFSVSLGYRASLFRKTELGLCLVGKVFA